MHQSNAPRHQVLKPAIAYLRVSSEGQGRRGFGLEAQRRQIEEFARVAGFEVGILDWHQDIASARVSYTRSGRPGLTQAVLDAATRKIPLIVARIDRVSRRSSDVMKLCGHAALRIISAEDGTSADLAILVGKAARAESDGDALSASTKEGLAKAKASGRRLGNPRLSEVRQKGADTNRRKADLELARLRPILADLRGGGIISRPKIAAELNARRVRTSSGRPWTASNVRRIEEQIAASARARAADAATSSHDALWGIL